MAWTVECINVCWRDVCGSPALHGTSLTVVEMGEQL